jgi:hypothetical protein
MGLKGEGDIFHGIRERWGILLRIEKWKGFFRSEMSRAKALQRAKV